MHSKTSARREIRLLLPADPEYGRVARAAAHGLARRMGFDHAGAEDLCLAVDEMLILLLRPHGNGGKITLVFDPRPGSLVVSATTTARQEGAGADDASRQRFETLVEPVVDEWEVSFDGTSVRLVKTLRRDGQDPV